MKTFPPGSPQALQLDVQRVLEVIQQVNGCLPTASGVQAATAGLTNACTDFTAGQSVYDLQLATAICWLYQQVLNGPTQVLVTDGVDIILDGLTFRDNLWLWRFDAKSFSFPTLTNCDQGIFFSTNEDDGNMTFLQTINLPLLATVNSMFFASRLPNLTTILAPSLTDVGLDIAVASDARLTTVDFSAIVNIGRDFLASGSLINGLKMPNLASFGGTQFKCDANAIPTEDVNALLVTLSGLGLSGVDINFAGGANGAPSGAGLTAKSTLQGQGNTVTTN